MVCLHVYLLCPFASVLLPMGLFTCLPNYVVILCFCTNSEKIVRPLHFVYILCPFVIGMFTFYPRVFT